MYIDNLDRPSLWRGILSERDGVLSLLSPWPRLFCFIDSPFLSVLHKKKEFWKYLSIFKETEFSGKSPSVGWVFMTGSDLWLAGPARSLHGHLWPFCSLSVYPSLTAGALPFSLKLTLHHQNPSLWRGRSVAVGTVCHLPSTQPALGTFGNIPCQTHCFPFKKKFTYIYKTFLLLSCLDQKER